jgi:PKD repeat protein
MEYFFDTDPGLGLGLQLNVSDMLLDKSLALDISQLTQGSHSLYIRSKDSHGHWSFPVIKNFLCQKVYPVANMQSAEYFIDNDPGLSQGVQLSVADINTTNITLIDISQLSLGSHCLYIRVKDSRGNWSFPVIKIFLIQKLQPVANMKYAEYYFDTDPGLGKGVKINVNDILQKSTLIFDISMLTLGKHTLFARILDSNGNWNFPVVQSFCNSPKAIFSVDKSYYCLGEAVKFIDQTIKKDTSTKYQWDFDLDGKIDGYQKGNVQYTYAKWGIYQARLMLSQNDGCADTFSLKVMIKEVPKPLGVIGDTSLCQSPGNKTYMANLTGYADTSIWDVPKNFASTYPIDSVKVKLQISPEYTGGATVKAKGQNTCGIGDWSQPLSINVYKYPVPEFSSSVLYRSVVSFTNQSYPSDSYLWSFGDGRNSILADPIYTYRPDSTYLVQLIARNHLCSVSITKYVVAIETSKANFTFTQTKPLIADAGNDKNISVGGKIQIGGNPAAQGGSSPYSYIWNPVSSLDFYTNPNPTATVNTTSTFLLTVTDARNCVATDTVVVYVNSLNGVGAVFSNGLKMYPNPCMEALTIQFNSNVTIKSYDVLNSQGQVLLPHSTLLSDIEMLQIDVQNLNSGFYVLRINVIQGNVMIPFIKN